MSKTKRQTSNQKDQSGFVNRTSILSHVARHDRSTLEDETTLVLSYRSIGPEVTSLKQLGPKKRLMEINTVFLDHNSLRKFEPAERISTVKELYLDHNYIKEVDGANYMLSKVNTLSLTSNKLTEIKNMDGFLQLKTLRLGNNRLTTLKSFTGGQVSNTLDTLVLSHNQIAHMHDIAALANFPALSKLDLRGNPLGTSPEVMKFVLLCCPNLRVFNGRDVTDSDVVASSEWASSSSRGRSVYCLIEVVREMETLTSQARQRSSTGLLRSDFIAYLSTYDEGGPAASAKQADEYIRNDPKIRSFKDPRFLAEEDRDIIRKEQLLAQYDAKVASERAAGETPQYDDYVNYEDEVPEYEDYEDEPAAAPSGGRGEPAAAPSGGRGEPAAAPSGGRGEFSGGRGEPAAAPSGGRGKTASMVKKQVPPQQDKTEDPRGVQQDSYDGPDDLDYGDEDNYEYPTGPGPEPDGYDDYDMHGEPADNSFDATTRMEPQGQTAPVDFAPGANAGVYEAEEDEPLRPGTLPPSKLARQKPPSEADSEHHGDDYQPEYTTKPTVVPESEEAAYGKKVLATKKNFGILSRRERILNVRYMTDTIKETSKNQNTLLESKVRSLFIQHLREDQ